MVRHRGLGILCATAPALALLLTAAQPAQAASLQGWRVVFSHHYGVPTAGATYLAVTAPARQTAWAVGGAGGSGSPATGSPAAARWRNGAWRTVRLPALSGTLGAVSASSATNAWAVSIINGYALRWNGTKWSVARRWPEPKHALRRELTGVTAISPDDVWVFGGGGAYPGIGTWHFNGTSWAHVTSAPGNGIETASALSRTNIWAIGSATAPDGSIAHYTGSWHTVSAAALAGLQFSAIVAVSKSDIWALGALRTNNFRPRLVHRTGHGWSRISLPWRAAPVDLAPDGHGGLWITAESSSGLLRIHRSATGQLSRTVIGPNASMLRLTLIPGTASLWGVGSVKSGSGVNAAVWAHGSVG